MASPSPAHGHDKEHGPRGAIEFVTPCAWCTMAAMVNDFTDSVCSCFRWPRYPSDPNAGSCAVCCWYLSKMFCLLVVAPPALVIIPLIYVLELATGFIMDVVAHVFCGLLTCCGTNKCVTGAEKCCRWSWRLGHHELGPCRPGWLCPMCCMTDLYNWDDGKSHGDSNCRCCWTPQNGCGWSCCKNCQCCCGPVPFHGEQPLLQQSPAPVATPAGAGATPAPADGTQVAANVV